MKGVQRFVPAVLSLLVFLAIAGWSGAREGAVLSEAELTKRLAGLKEELATEEKALTGSQEHWANELEGRQRESRKAATSLLELQLQSEALIQERERLEKALGSQAKQSLEILKTLDSVLAAGQIHGQQLNFYLQEIPGSQLRMKAVDDSLGELKDGHNKDKGIQVAALLTLFNAVHSDACQVKVRKQRLFTANGQQEEVHLLSVGSISFAYQSLDKGRVGIALGSPEEASGYRWVEQLPPALRPAMDRVFTALSGNQVRAVGIPLDISRRLRVNALLDKKDLMSHLESGGWIMIPLALIAVLALLLILERQVVFMLQGSSASAIQKVFGYCHEGQFDEALDHLRTSRGLVARVLVSCLERRLGGQEAMENGIQERLLYELPKLQKRLGGISVLGAVAPLLGLLGTVTGIIQTFGVIKVFGNTNPGLMAGGISEALITTASGLVIAIPILLLHSSLNGRMDRLISDAEKFAATLLNILLQSPPKRAVEAATDQLIEDKVESMSQPVALVEDPA